MTLNASIVKDEAGHHRVLAYKEVRCPACGRCLMEMQEPRNIKITCTRCKAGWQITETGEFKLLRPPKKMAGILLHNWTSNFLKKD